MRFDASLERVRDILLLIGLASGAAAATGAFVSVVSLYAVGGVAEGAFPRLFVLWWLTHAMGILVIAPVGLTLSRSRETLLRRDPIEVIGVLSAVGLVSWFPFVVSEDQIVSRLFFLPFPLLLWAALRLGMAGAALGGLITTWIAMIAAVAHWGPMSIGTPNDTLILTWIFANVVILSTLISAALVEEMRRARAEHEVGELRLRAVLDAASEGIVVADATGTVTHVNPATTRLWPAALTAPAMREPIARSLEPLAAMLQAPAERALLSATPERTGVRGALTFPDGHVWEVEVDQLSGTELTGARIWSFHDVTARVRAETERLRFEAQLLHTQKLESLGVLAGGIAHDFNNLLMGIRARAELIGMAEPKDPEITEDVTAILKTSDQAAALCRQMLVYAGRGAIAVRTIDLSSCAREIQEMLRVSVSRQVDLVLALSAEPLTVAGDVTQLRQVVMNLVTNGSDAVEATGHSGTVRVRTRRAFLDRAWLSRTVLLVAERQAHEIGDDRRGKLAAGAALAHGFWNVVADIDADRQIGRVADEPGIALVVRSAGLAGHGLADDLEFLPGAALHDTFHHRGDLVGGIGAHHLLADIEEFGLGEIGAPFRRRAAAAVPPVMAEYGAAVAVLDAVDQRGVDLLAAVVDHRIGRHHLQQRGLARPQRHGQLAWQLIINT